MSEEPKKPYGDVEYADPGYQSDKQKRYPIDTEEHARAAWSYINQQKNAAQYSADDLAKVRARIKRACKKFGIEVSGEETRASSMESDDDAIQCRTAIELSGVLNDEITYLPVGLHSITPVQGGIDKPIEVLIDRSSAIAMEDQLHKLMARRKQPYFDFNHEDAESSFWPSHFFWREGEGVVAKGDWSTPGRKAIEGKSYRAFSPVFYVNDKRASPAHVVCRSNAKPNMGGLVNDPAFNNLPLWAKNDGKPVNAGATGDNKPKETKKMDTEEMAALRAKNEELEKRIDEMEALIEANQEDATTHSELKAARAEHTVNSAKMKLAEQELIIARQAEEIRAGREAKVDAAIREAIARGSVRPQDLESRKTLKASAMADESFINVIRSIPSPKRDFTERLTGSSSRYELVSADPQRILCRLYELSEQSRKTTSPKSKFQIAQEFAAIYAAEVSPDSIEAQKNSKRVINYPFQSVYDAIVAGDVTDANLGTLSGTLVTQRVLELLKFTFPEIGMFTTDFSDQPAQYGQTIMTRTVTIPAVQTYSTVSGWTSSTAATTDVPVSINNHKGVQIVFNENILASSVRRLFSEFAEASMYALGKAMVDSLYGVITDANFTNNTISTAANFNRSACVDLENALTKRGVPFSNRTLLLYPDCFASLEKDTALVTYAAYQSPQIVTVGTTPSSKFVIPVASFTVVNAPNLPSNNANLNGFAGSRSALIIATRVPSDYTSVLGGASYGSVAMVTEPDIGITVMQVQYVSHDLGTATSRVALMWGVAAGQGNAGQLLKAASGSGSSH